MTNDTIRAAVLAYLAKGGAVKRGPTLYADGCRSVRDRGDFVRPRPH